MEIELYASDVVVEKNGTRCAGCDEDTKLYYGSHSVMDCLEYLRLKIERLEKKHEGDGA